MTSYLLDAGKVDVQTFAKDLAEALGGTYEAAAETYDRQTFGHVIMEHLGVRLTIHANTYSTKAPKVDLSLRATDVPSEVHKYFYGAKYKLPRITLSVTRPMAQLVKDITKRLLDAAADPLTAQREVAAREDQSRDNIKATVAALSAAVPGIKTRVSDSGTEASFSLSDPSISGRIYGNGAVGIVHIYSCNTIEALVRVLAALKPQQEG